MDDSVQSYGVTYVNRPQEVNDFVNKRLLEEELISTKALRWHIYHNICDSAYHWALVTGKYTLSALAVNSLLMVYDALK